MVQSLNRDDSSILGRDDALLAHEVSKRTSEIHLRSQEPYVEAIIPYLASSLLRPFRYMEAPPDGEPKERGHRDLRIVRVWNGWADEAALDLEVQGFRVVKRPTEFDAFDDDEAIRRRYYPEMARVALAETGAQIAHVFDHNVRRADAAPSRTGGKPARLVHNDYTAASGPKRLVEVVGADAACLLEGRRFCIVNLWRPILEPLEDTPLAVCDARTIRPRDMVESDLIYPDRKGEIYQITFGLHHRWVYFPKQRREEILLLKCFDSMTDGRARFTPHTAFDDPQCRPDAPGRHSIEVRVLLIW